MKRSVALLIALVAITSTAVFANTPRSNSTRTSSDDELLTVKTRELFIAGKRVLIRPDGTLATKYAPTRRRIAHHAVRRTSNGSNLAVKNAIAKTDKTVKGVNKRLKNIEIGFDAVQKTAQENRKNAQEALISSKVALAATKNTSSNTTGGAKWVPTAAMLVIFLIVIALIVVVVLFVRRTEEIGVIRQEFQSLDINNTASHNGMKDRLTTIEKELKSNTEAIKSFVAKEEAKRNLNADPPTDDPPTSSTAIDNSPVDITTTGRFPRPIIA